MMRLALLSVAVPLALLVSAGCPLGPSTETADPDDITPRVSATVSANEGEHVTLTAQLLNIDDPNEVTFQWYPPEGWTVEPEDANTPSASFEVPPVATDERPEFRVEVTTADGTMYSDTVEAMAVSSSGLSDVPVNFYRKLFTETISKPKAKLIEVYTGEDQQFAPHHRAVQVRRSTLDQLDIVHRAQSPVEG